MTVDEFLIKLGRIRDANPQMGDYEVVFRTPSALASQPINTFDIRSFDEEVELS